MTLDVVSRPDVTRSPRWSVLLRFGVGVTAFALFVLLFSDGSGIGFGLLAVGVALLLCSGASYVGTRRPSR